MHVAIATIIQKIINTVDRLAEHLTTNAGDSKETAMLCSEDKHNHSEGDVAWLDSQSAPFKVSYF